MEQILIHKKLRRLLISYDSLTKEEAIQTIKEIRVSLQRIFKYHIGEENSISPTELFSEVLFIEPDKVEVFKREYYWNVIKAVLKQLKKEDILFVINKKTKLFVLQTQKEANDYKKVIDTDIKNLASSKRKAYEWVRKEKWRNL